MRKIFPSTANRKTPRRPQTTLDTTPRFLSVNDFIGRKKHPNRHNQEHLPVGCSAPETKAKKGSSPQFPTIPHTHNYPFPPFFAVLNYQRPASRFRLRRFAPLEGADYETSGSIQLGRVTPRRPLTKTPPRCSKLATPTNLQNPNPHHSAAISAQADLPPSSRSHHEKAILRDRLQK